MYVYGSNRWISVILISTVFLGTTHLKAGSNGDATEGVNGHGANKSGGVRFYGATKKFAPSNKSLNHYNGQNLYYNVKSESFGNKKICGGMAIMGDNESQACLTISPAPPASPTVNTFINVSTTAVTPKRKCAEAPAYSVIELSQTTATLSSPPVVGCLSPGDEVLLVNQQGTSLSQVNVGQWELLTLQSVKGSTLTFRDAKTKYYGKNASDDSEVGRNANQQRVSIVRIPRFTNLTIAQGSTITANAWDGYVGGILPLKAETMQVNGSIIGSQLGYRSPPWSYDGSACSNNSTTQFGESIGGNGVQLGGGGNVLAASGISFVGNRPVNAGAGHATKGDVGGNANGRVLGQFGGSYGVSDGTRLTMGSGTGGNVTCNPSGVSNHPGYWLGGGGIVVLLAEQLVVSATGSVQSNGYTNPLGINGSGGYVYINAKNTSVRQGGISVSGGPANAYSARSGDGYIFMNSPTTPLAKNGS